MLAFTDTVASKAQLVANLEKHRAADHLIQGDGYWRDGKGCAVGCSLVDFGANPADHSAYERLFGIPRILAHLEDGIFEGLPVEDAKAWPLRFANAVQPGADLSLIWPKFAVFLLVDKDHGVVKFASEKSKLAIEAVASLYSRQIAGDTPTAEDFRQAQAAADAAAYAAAAAAAAHADAAAYAAYAAADAAYAAADAAAAAYAAYAAADAAAHADAAAYAAYAAADAAAYAAADAAYAAYAAAYAAYAHADAHADGRAKNAEWRRVRGEVRKRQADKLIELLEAA